jgi:hypothetical protein
MAIPIDAIELQSVVFVVPDLESFGKRLNNARDGVLGQQRQQSRIAVDAQAGRRKEFTATFSEIACENFEVDAHALILSPPRSIASCNSLSPRSLLVPIRKVSPASRASTKNNLMLHLGSVHFTGKIHQVRPLQDGPLSSAQLLPAE